ncbi:MAG: hypothetical protein QOF14_636 [Hyphomicrobiales bacterium]|nr:hypothetical protein [Hyphomicrobiales bacterium]
MTGLELYLLIAPLALATFGAIGAYIFIRIVDRKHPRPR